jgi:hypothetical protein
MHLHTIINLKQNIMKNLLLFLTVITFAFQSCSKSDDSAPIDDDPIVEVCDMPLNASVSTITEYSAVLNWDNPNTELDVRVEYGLAGFSQGSGTIISSSQNAISINDLTPGTSYEFYVQAICAADNTSTQSAVSSFSTDDSQFAGTWSGTYDGDDDGTWIMVISAAAEFVSGSSYSNNANATFAQVAGTVEADGSTTSTSENGTQGVGQIIGENSTGTWVNGSISGTAIGSRE